MYTSHGHQIQGTPVEGVRPPIARCSAGMGCPQCRAEIAIYKQAVSIEKEDTSESKILMVKKIMDENNVDLQTAVRMFNRRCKPGTKVCDWTNSDGRFGVAVVEESDGGQLEIITEIEMTPEELIALATSCLVLAERKKSQS